MFRLARAAALAILALVTFHPAGAATPVHIVKADIKALIRAAYQTPVQFAVLVPHTASPTTAGIWTVSGDTATWRYAVEVPTAVSLSFHATQSLLPASATLFVQGAKTSGGYRTRDLHRGELWSRIYPGQAIELTLTVATAERSKVALNIVSLQAGYRGVGPGVADHPYYRKLRAELQAASGTAACVTNYECQVTPSNTPAGAATVALLIGNQFECSGSLINDVPGDNTPYVLTARHCENGKLGGGNPGAASSVTVYWDATAACGATLGSLYDPGIPTQTGAQTVVEQQDAWLIELDASPAVSDAQFAGFDASGGAIQGGYTLHHAEGYDKQFVEWYGQAYAVQQSGVLGTTYTSNFWETVNQLGNVGPGASGSGLFDQNNHLVGSLSLGRTTNDPSGYGACPVAPLTAPNGNNGVADFTSLAAIWSSTADATSTTGTVTLKSLLDPANTGTVVIPAVTASNLTFAVSSDVSPTGTPVTLSWSASGATQCTASGGVSGDGWSGTLAASGSQAVDESTVNFVSYGLSCQYPGGILAKRAVTVSWLGPNPQVQLTGPTPAVWISAPVTLSWTSNVTPCSLTGGGLSLSNLPASGTTTTTQATSGDVNYTLTCGAANQPGISGVTVSYVTPSLVLNANGTDRQMGVPFFLVWTTVARTCTPSGGAPGDGWANTEYLGFFATIGEPVYLTVTMPGTYTYTLSCSDGPNTVTQSVTVIFENNPPYVNLSLNPTTVTFSNSPADYATLGWSTNQAACGFNAPTALVLSETTDPYLSDGQSTAAPSQSGVFQITAYCYPTLSTGPYSATSNVTLTVQPPPPPTLAITFNPTSVSAGESFTASWSATNSSGCQLTGGVPGGLWGGSVQGVPATGSDSESGPAGQYSFGLTCSSIDPASPSVSAQANLTISPLTATLTANPTSVTSGSSFTLTWSSVGATGCTASGGGADGSQWSGMLAPSGSTTQTASTTGSFTYTISCAAGNVSASSQASVTVSAPAGGGGGGGHGGGGGLGLLELGSLAVLAGVRVARRRRFEQPAIEQDDEQCARGILRESRRPLSL